MTKATAWVSKLEFVHLVTGVALLDWAQLRTQNLGDFLDQAVETPLPGKAV